jgi:hypothetical protein
MASETLIKLAVKLGKQLGANTSKFLGTKSNITFMGSGPKDGMLFQKSIDPESFATIGIEKILPDIESSLGYATGGKLNDIQMNKLIDNLTTMTETLNPTNVSKGNFGIDALRAKSGMVERQATDVASSERPINRSGELTSIADEPGQSGMSYAIKNPAKIPGDESNVAGMRPTDDTLNKLVDEHSSNVEKLRQTDAEGGTAIGYEEFKALQKRNAQIEEVIKNARKVEDESPAFASFNTAENIDTSSPLMSKLENRIGGMRDQTEAATGIMASVPRGDLPGKTAAAREFLVNTLKVGDDYPTTKLDDIISAEDFKYIMEGGGGAEGDPLVLVQKYFGPRIAEMIPTGGTTEEIAIFTKKILNNVEDAKGLKPNEEGFDNMTAKIVEDFADGGIARLGFKFGGSSKFLKKINSKMIKKAADDIFPTDDYKYDAELVVDALVENNPKIFKNMLAGDLDDALRSELYGLAVSETGNRAAMKIRSGRMERPLFDENGKLNKDAVLADASKYEGLDGRKLPTEKEGMKMAKNMSDEEFEVRGQFPSMSDDMIKSSLNNKRVRPRFQLNVDKAVSELNIPREEAIRIAQLPSDQQKLALQEFMDINMAQKLELMKYSPKKFDAAKGGRAGYSKGGLAKILEL